MPATTDWSMSSPPIGARLRLIRSQASSGSASGRSGSGPSRSTSAVRCSGVCSSQAVAPRRSAYDVTSSATSARTSRSRTWPTGAGTSAASRETSKRPYRPRWTWTRSSWAKWSHRCLPHDSAPSSTRPSSSAADCAKRPCGLLTRTGWPANASPSAVARRWRVCPSGIRPLAAAPGVLSRFPGGLRQGRELAGALVLADLAQAAGVPLLLAERRGQEDLDEPRHVPDQVHAAADRDDLRVVVLAPQARGLLRPGQRAADSRHLVGGDLLTVAGAADHHSQAVQPLVAVGGHPGGGAQAEDGVVVQS